MFSSLKSLFRPGQGARNLVVIDKGDLTQLRLGAQAGDMNAQAAMLFAGQRDRYGRALDAILALPPTVRVKRAQDIAREARNG